MYNCHQNIVIAVAPVIAYYSQYSLIAQTKSVGSFSIDICAILIISNIMRIYFWFFSGFATNLFIQSFIVIGIQFLLLDICIKVGYKKQQDKNKIGIWRWDKLDHFVIFTIIFAIVMGTFSWLFKIFQIKSYGTVLGLLSLMIQATLGIPQLIQNQRSKSVAGLSIFMIITWFIGDFLKTLYFVIELQPFQFILSGSFQLAIDTLILVQVMAYGGVDIDKQKYKNINVKGGEVQGETDGEYAIQFGGKFKNGNTNI